MQIGCTGNMGRNRIVFNYLEMILSVKSGVDPWSDAPKIKIGICAMGKKTTSKAKLIFADWV